MHINEGVFFHAKTYINETNMAQSGTAQMRHFLYNTAVINCSTCDYHRWYIQIILQCCPTEAKRKTKKDPLGWVWSWTRANFFEEL